MTPRHLKEVFYEEKHTYIVDEHSFKRTYTKGFCHLPGCSNEVVPKIVFEGGKWIPEPQAKHKDRKYCCTAHASDSQKKIKNPACTKLYVPLNATDRAFEQFILKR